VVQLAETYGQAHHPRSRAKGCCTERGMNEGTETRVRTMNEETGEDRAPRPRSQESRRAPQARPVGEAEEGERQAPRRRIDGGDGEDARQRPVAGRALDARARGGGVRGQRTRSRAAG
jgi:hypothetical protein